MPLSVVCSYLWVVFRASLEAAICLSSGAAGRGHSPGYSILSCGFIDVKLLFPWLRGSQGKTGMKIHTGHRVWILSAVGIWTTHSLKLGPSSASLLGFLRGVMKGTGHRAPCVACGHFFLPFLRSLTLLYQMQDLMPVL
jgi:hypothetical protein